MIFEIDWSTQTASATSRCAVPGILVIPDSIQARTGVKWLIVTSRHEWWTLGDKGLKGPYLNLKPTFASRIHWSGPIIMNCDPTKSEGDVRGYGTPSPWTVSIGSRRYEISKPTLIGRNGVCTIRMNSPLVSGIHGLMAPSGDCVHYFDLGSRNGTFDPVGSRVSSSSLLNGHSLRLGDKVVQVSRTASNQDKTALTLESPSMIQLERLIAKVAPSNAPVVIYGESGVGKELVANSIHRQSGLSGPLITANAACFSPQLARSELFGHVAGAFTGATSDRQGLFSAAHGGTLFLDEVAEMPLSVQAELLRSIETGLINPLGSTGPRVARPRIVVASHKNLENEVSAGRFRQDLYYRLCVVKLSIAPLRERPEDIESLAQHFVKELCKGHVLSSDTVLWLKVQPWKGNVRALRNLFWKASVLCPAKPTELFNLKHLLDENGSVRVVRDDVIRVFFELGEDIQETARALQLHRSTVHRHIKSYRNGLPAAA